MLFPIFILCLSHLVLATPVQPEYDVEDIEQLKYHFNDFKVKYNRSYTAEEEELRLSHFKENLVEIMELRKRNPFAEFVVNKFADRSAQERNNLVSFKDNKIGSDLGKCTLLPTPCPVNGSDTYHDSLDYRDKNAVTPVQDQGYCRSGWAFSATGVVEGAYALMHKELVKLSEQQLLDCDQESEGCHDGWPHYGFSILLEQGGQQLESDYPYQEKSNVCTFDKSKVKAKLTACQVFQDAYEDFIISWLLLGPIAIALDPYQFYFFKKGIITDCNYHNINHAVLLIGYGEENGIPYWLFKNSWGADWGDEGYVKVDRKKNCLSIGKYMTSVQVLY